MEQDGIGCRVVGKTLFLSDAKFCLCFFDLGIIQF